MRGDYPIPPSRDLPPDRLAERRRGPAGRFDLLAGALREEVRGHGQLLLQLAVAEDLDVGARVLDEPLLDEGVQRDVGAVV